MCGVLGILGCFWMCDWCCCIYDLFYYYLLGFDFFEWFVVICDFIEGKGVF